MTPNQWILIAAIVVVLLIIIALVAGYLRRKKNTISFEEKKQPEELTQAEKSGNYQAQGGFNFAPASSDAKEKAPEVLPGQEIRRPGTAEAASPVIPDAPRIPTPPATETTRDDSVVDEDELREVEKPESIVVKPEPEAEPEPVGDATEDDVKDALAEVEESLELESVELDEAEIADEAPVEVSEPAIAQEAPVMETPVQEPAAAQELDQIDPAEGRIHRLRGRLSRSQNAIGQSVLGILGAGDLDEDAWEEIEDTLIMADLGATTTMSVVEKLRERIASRGISSEAEARALLREVLIEECQPDMDRSIRALPHEGKPAVILVVGVNGTGKTTTTGKLARVLVAQGHKVVLGAADTFRAAAADQLETWGRRVGAETVRGAEGADPASVAFDAVAHGIDTQADVVIVDTAGRLHTKTGLMDQLDKIKRVVEKRSRVDEVILVLDATVGQNGLTQARTFRDVVDITGVALTKLDGTAKGGIVFQVQRELGVPVKLVGLGEGADHLAPFEPAGFVDALLGTHN
ncbi:signal recognition particle-docking protein FtsY [Corynebacterium sp. H113]|uniref:signal recognition particle-docking protein FtsY n=1 Tax=Corynebacterium sp. H113 TaxID=3133419 RepID=UPI0030B28CC2